LLYALGGVKTRPTKDIDFSGRNIDNNPGIIADAVKQICSIQYAKDCAWFDANSVTAELITEQKKYGGVRLTFNAGFDSIKNRLQIDIGFGDVLTPDAMKMEYPVLIPGFANPVVLVYSTETIIAEKFHAMIELSSSTSRMKDFYDIYKLLTEGNFRKDIVKEAIKATFINRQTPYSENQMLFDPHYSEDKQRQTMWKAFLRKTGLNLEIPFDEVVTTITSELKPCWENLKPRTSNLEP
jgi:hypothetical protein